MEIKCLNPKLRQDQIAKELGCSRSTLQRNQQDKIMLSLHKIPSNSHKIKQNIPKTNLDDNSNLKHDLKMTSNDLKRILSNY